MESNSRFHNISVSSDPLNLETVERIEKKLQNIEYLENEKTFLDEIKNIFITFGILSLGKI